MYSVTAHFRNQKIMSEKKMIEILYNASGGGCYIFIICQIVNRKKNLEINQTNKAASEFSLARCFRLSYLFLQEA